MSGCKLELTYRKVLKLGFKYLFPKLLKPIELHVRTVKIVRTATVSNAPIITFVFCNTSINNNAIITNNNAIIYNDNAMNYNDNAINIMITL